MKKHWYVSIVVVCLALVFGLSTADAATHSRFVTGVPVPEPTQGAPYVISNTLYFNDLQTRGPSGTGYLAGVSSADTVRLLPIPAGTIVRGVGVYIKSAWGTAGVTCGGVTIGDGDVTNGWLRAVDFGPTASGVSTSSGTSAWSMLGTAGTSVIVSGAYASTGGKMYTTEDTIDAVLPAVQGWGGIAAIAGLTDFQLTIWADCVKPSTQYKYKRK